jgi:endonuclease-8
VPEGDTIHRAAARLEPVLTGAVLERFDAPRAPRPHPRRGERIVSVEARGKHLLVAFEGGLVLDTHMGMSGSWHVYEAGRRWRMPAHLARVVIDVEGWTAVCFAAPTVRVAPAPEMDRSSVGQLGPDLCDPNADLDEAARRMRAVAPETELADALLDQRVCAGVGNVYKSEVCFACRVHPQTPMGALDPALVERLVATAARQLRANLGRGARSTVGARPGIVAVYGRARQPCRRCGTPISVARTGRHRRTTYWCPRCQPAPASKTEHVHGR